MAEENKHILCQITLAVEFLGKAGSSLSVSSRWQGSFSNEDTNRGYFVATLQPMAKTDPILNEHLDSAKWKG